MTTTTTTSGPSLRRHTGQRALHRAADIEDLIRRGSAIGATRAQEAWISRALLDESYELFVVRDGQEDVAVVDLSRGEGGDVVVTLRGLPGDLTPGAAGVVSEAVAARLTDLRADVVVTSDAVLAQALENGGWAFAGHVGGGRLRWARPGVPAGR